MACPACGNLWATLLGRLGRLTWLRCRDCGVDYSTENHIHEVEDTDDDE